MWNIKIADKFIIDKALSSVDSRLFDASYVILDTYLNHDLLKLYVAEKENELRLISYKERPDGFGRDARILFIKGLDDTDLIKSISEFLQPGYIAYNCLLEKSENGARIVTNDELVIDLATVANLSSPRIKKEYRRAEEAHPNLETKLYDSSDIQAVKEFLEKWKSDVIGKKVYARIDNDLYYLNNYAQSKESIGLLLFEGDKVVGISFLLAQNSDFCISVLNKVLRGYRELGTYLYVEKSRYMLNRGFKKSNLGGINNDFKRKFDLNGEYIKLYAEEIFHTERFIVKDGVLSSLVR